MFTIRKLIASLVILLLVLVALPTAGNTATGAEPFRIIVIPDTQWNSMKWPELNENTTKWIAAKRDAKNIKFVLHVGDMVQNAGSEQEWANFDKAITHLDGNVSYALAPGNHDVKPTAEGQTATLFNEHFPLSRMAKQKTFGGSFPEGKSDNTYHTFTGGGIEWLVITLTYNPNDEELKWASDVAAKHPDHRAIIVTHCYLSGPKRNSVGDNIWKNFVSKHENIAMVFCGHVIAVARITSEGEKDNTVHQMLFDWQNPNNQDPNTYIAIVEIDPDEKRLSVNSYSPTLDQEKTDAACKFVLENVDFLKQ